MVCPTRAQVGLTVRRDRHVDVGRGERVEDDRVTVRRTPPVTSVVPPLSAIVTPAASLSVTLATTLLIVMPL